MADPTTVNTSLAIPIRGTDVGTWDVPVNNNFIAIDNMFGGVTAIALSNVNVTLLSSQAQASIIRLTGTLANNVNIVMPSIFKGLRFDNQITNSLSSYAVFAATPGSSYFAGIPPGVNDMFFDGTKVDWANLGRIGEYWDYADKAVPTWCSGASKPPYLLCNGTTFSSATYPILRNLLGTTTLPDARGRVRMAMNLGTGRVTIFDGDQIYLGGGDQQVQAHTHTGSGTTSVESADHFHSGGGNTGTESAAHYHFGSGTTGTISADHFHSGGGTTDGENAAHNHNYNTSDYQAAFSGFGPLASLATGAVTGTENQAHAHVYSFSTGGVSANHTHDYSFNTGTESAGHFHGYSFTTSGISANHTHTYSFTTSSFGAGASLNVQPTFVGGVTMIRAA